MSTFPVPPICPFCNNIPEIDALCYFTCQCDANSFVGELKLIDIEDIDKGHELVWFSVAFGEISKRIAILVEYNSLRHSIIFNNEYHYTHYYEGQSMMTILEAKKLLIKYYKMKAFL
jgi:hypothetical protein